MAPKLSEKVVSARAKLTVPYSKECFEDLKSAKTHWEKFLDIGGMHTTHDDFFIAAEKNKRKQEYAELLKERKARKGFQKQEEDALAVLAKELSVEKMNATELGTNLKWNKIPSSKQGSKQAIVAKWKTIKENKKPPPTFDKWTDQDEHKLHDLKSYKIEMKDTVLGRMEVSRTQESEASFTSLTKEEQNNDINRLKTIHEEKDDGA